MTTRQTRRRALPAVAWSLLIVAALATPGDGIPDPEFWGRFDTPVHALLFAIHYGLLVRALAGSPFTGRRLEIAALGSALFAAVMEAAQLWIPGRGWEWGDLLAGWAGIAVAAGLVAGRRARLRASR